MDNKDQVIGVIFPFFPEHARRFLEDQKSVFVKFFGRGAMPRHLRVGSRLFFYESQSKQEIVGEARIVEVGLGTDAEVLARYSDRLFLTSTEFEKYVGNRKGKQLLILVVENPKRYKTPMKTAKPITMTGQYMTLEAYRALQA